MPLIAGIDFSSKAIHAALISLDADDGSDAPPVTLRSFVMPTWRGGTTPAFRSVERCRVVRDAMRELLAPLWPPDGDENVVHVCVETPFGASRKADNVMRELYGAILACVPSHIERDTITTNDWRRLVLAEDALAEAGRDLKAAAIGQAYLATGNVMDEHQAEAFLIARACRARLDKAFTA